MARPRADVVELEPSAWPEVLDLLSASFADDPGVRWFCAAEGEEYERRRRRWLELGQGLFRAAGQPVLGVREGGALAGAALFLDPGRAVPALSQLGWLLSVAWSCSPRMAWRVLRNVRGGERFHPRGPHLYFIQIGTPPGFRGRGYGGVLLDAVHARSAAHPLSAGVALETENPANVPLYERFGYRVVGETRLGPIVSVAMFRPEPR